MNSNYRRDLSRRLRNGFETVQGLPIIWQVVCWDAVNKGTSHAMVRPLSTEANAKWARGVLTKQYPGRTYEVNCYPLAKPVETAQLTTFESWAMDEVKRLELAQRQAG
ncbi:hypothetical protein ACMFY5_26260 [Pseudomonas sihuiensis]|jgi:hypothetical protein